MRRMNEFIATAPFDFYELTLFHLALKHGSFTKAGEAAGLTQSAVTRQIQGMEDRLGVKLFDRTTRSVSPTAAGRFLFERSGTLLGSLNEAVSQLRQHFDLVTKSIRVGFSRSIGYSYLPGFLVAYRRKFPEIQLQVVHQPSGEILRGLEAAELDVGVVSPPPRLPVTLRIKIQFDDDFSLVAPASLKVPASKIPVALPKLIAALGSPKWLLLNRESNTGKRLHSYLARQGVEPEPAMELDNFDLIVNLVSLGLGVSIVPHRALPLYLQRRALRKIQLIPKFTRKLAVVVRKMRERPEHIDRFIDEILF